MNTTNILTAIVLLMTGLSCQILSPLEATVDIGLLLAVRLLTPAESGNRLLVMTAVWTAVALLVTGLILSTVFRNNAQRDFERLLTAHAFNLMGSFDVDEAGQVSGAPNMGDPRFETPLSG